MLLVGARGFEPPTSRSRTVRSTRLSHAPTEMDDREGSERCQIGRQDVIALALVRALV